MRSKNGVDSALLCYASPAFWDDADVHPSKLIKILQVTNEWPRIFESIFLFEEKIFINICFRDQICARLETCTYYYYTQRIVNNSTVLWHSI